MTPIIKTFSVQRMTYKWAPWTNSYDGIKWIPRAMEAESAEAAAEGYLRTLGHHHGVEICALVDGQRFVVKCELTIKAVAK